MSCRFRDDVCRLADAELSFARRVVVEAHLAVCDDCARVEETLEAVHAVLAAGDERPLGVVEETLAGLRRPRRVPVAAIAAAAAAVGAAVLWWPREGAAPPPTPPRPPAARVVRIPPPRPAQPLREALALLDAEGAAAEVRRRGAAGTAALARLLADPDSATRALAVAEREPSSALVPSLARLLEDPPLAARAARLLGIVATPDAVRALAAALDGPAAVEAREALVAAGAEGVLERRLESDASREMLDALVRAAPARGARALVRLAADEATVRPVLEARRARVLPELRRLARGSGAAALLLGWARDEDSRALLVELAAKSGTADPASRALLELGAVDEAFRAVCRTGAEASFDGARTAEPALLTILRRGRHAERATALRLLGRCGGPRTVAALAEMPLDRSLLPDAIDALGAIGGPDAIPVLARFAGEPALRRPLVRALAGIPDSRSARLLVDELGRPGARVPASAALASMPAGIVVPVLLERFERDPRQVRRVLADIAGADLGGRLGAWRRWWESQP